MIEGNKCGGSSIGPSLKLGLMEGMLQRLAVIAAKYIHEPAQCVLDDVIGFVIPIRTRLTKVGD